MMKRKRVKAAEPEDWAVEYEVTINGRKVGAGSELSIKGERGRFRFIRKVTRPERGIEWLDVWGGPKGCEQWRSFRPERVRRVHRIKTTAVSLMKDRQNAA